MDYLQKFIFQVRNRLSIALLLNNLILVLDWWILHDILHLGTAQILIGLGVVAILSMTILPQITTKFITEPTRLVWQAILHIAPDSANTPAPDIKKKGLGHELVTYLVSHVYQLASVIDSLEKTSRIKSTDLKTDFVANSLPLPMMVLDKNQTVIFANQAMCAYIQKQSADVIGQNMYSIMDMSFGSPNTLDSWLQNARANQAVATNTWERVRMAVGEYRKLLQFDLAAYYNKANPEGYETMLVLFDHTQSYEQDDQALSFVAVAVHELRVPVTLMRGYIEALEEELAGRLDAETIGFMYKMKISAESLSAFINNMLNVARVENDQLVLSLHQENWSEIVAMAVNENNLRARIQGVEIISQIDPNLPPVGVDRVSMYEVIFNLIDNAIKYRGTSQEILIKTYLTPDGVVETIVQDYGVGIPANIMPNLFEKFYRSHHSRSQVGGTGLGLYLAKAIVEAHGGKIWVRSVEGEGSTFGFTVPPYASLTEAQKTGETQGITRGAHGWIKNHSLYSQ